MKIAFASFETLDFESWLHNLPILIPWHISGLSTQFLLNFKTLTTIRALHPKNFFFLFNCYNLAICIVTLTEIFLQTIRIVRFKILWLKVEKNHFNLIFILHAMKYIFEAQYSPKRSWNFRGRQLNRNSGRQLNISTGWRWLISKFISNSYLSFFVCKICP
jgi:hypothetical protein